MSETLHSVMLKRGKFYKSNPDSRASLPGKLGWQGRRWAGLSHLWCCVNLYRLGCCKVLLLWVSFLSFRAILVLAVWVCGWLWGFGFASSGHCVVTAQPAGRSLLCKQRAAAVPDLHLLPAWLWQSIACSTGTVAIKSAAVIIRISQLYYLVCCSR